MRDFRPLRAELIPGHRAPTAPVRASLPGPLLVLLASLPALPLLATGPDPAAAQELEGRVVDGSTGRPVGLAYVALVTSDRRSIVAVTADDQGIFSVEPPSPGSYWVYASALGYQPVVDGLFEIGEGGAMEVEVRLQPDPVRMDSLRASVERTDRYLRQVGFYERREGGWGYHLDHEEIRRRAVGTVVDAIRDVPRLFVAEEGAAEVFRGHEGPFPDIVIRDRGGFCPPHVWLDGRLVHRGGEAGRRPEPDGPTMPDEWAHPHEIAAMEIYRGRLEIPARYNLPNTCGVLLIWTWH